MKTFRHCTDELGDSSIKSRIQRTDLVAQQDWSTIREPLLQLMNWVLLAVIVFIVARIMEQSGRGLERRQYSFDIILPTPAPVIEQIEHSQS